MPPVIITIGLRAADFFKLHVIMDEETRVIILATPSDRYCHDSKPLWNYFLPELEGLSKVFGFKISYVSADSAYTSNRAYKEVRERLNAMPGIKPCKGEGSSEVEPYGCLLEDAWSAVVSSVF